MYFLRIFKSNYCKIVFLFSLIGGYFFLPKNLLIYPYIFILILFAIGFSLVLTCLVRNIKERIVLSRTYKSSLLGIIASAFGIAALQACGIGAPVCGASIGAGIVSAIFPGVFTKFLSGYSLYIIAFSLLLQAVSLYLMNCFEK